MAALEEKLFYVLIYKNAEEMIQPWEAVRNQRLESDKAGLKEIVKKLEKCL